MADVLKEIIYNGPGTFMINPLAGMYGLIAAIVEKSCAGVGR